MTPNQLREWIAVVVLIGSLPLGAALAGCFGYAIPNYAPAGLGFIFIAACIGIRVGDWPPIEYGLALVIACVLAMLLMPRCPAAIGIPGAECAYLWGAWLASHIDHPHRATGPPTTDAR
jgi:predicted branched-subunit amino acid permease